MDASYLYYTLSTIPQVLAGVIALLAAFWIYRNENLNNKLKSTGRSVIREMGISTNREIVNYDPAKLHNVNAVVAGLVEQGDALGEKYSQDSAQVWIDRLQIRMNASIDQDDYDWIEYAIETIYKCHKNEVIKSIYNRFKSIDNDIKTFARNTRAGIILAAITILASTALIPFSDFINSVCRLPSLVLTVLLSLFTVTLGLITYSVVKTIKTKNVA